MFVSDVSSPSKSNWIFLLQRSIVHYKLIDRLHFVNVATFKQNCSNDEEYSSADTGRQNGSSHVIKEAAQVITKQDSKAPECEEDNYKWLHCIFVQQLDYNR